MYASFLGFCAPYIWIFLNSLFKIEFFNKLLRLIPHSFKAAKGNDGLGGQSFGLPPYDH